MNKTTKTILITLLISLTILPLLSIANATQNPQPKPIELKHLPDGAVFPQFVDGCWLPIKYNLVVVDPETNKTVGRGYVNFYIVYWLKEIEAPIVCWIDSENVTSDGYVYFEKKYNTSCARIITGEVYNAILERSRKAYLYPRDFLPFERGMMYYVFGYNDPLGEYVSEPDPRAYFSWDGQTTCHPRLSPLITPEPPYTPVLVLITIVIILIAKIKRIGRT